MKKPGIALLCLVVLPLSALGGALFGVLIGTVLGWATWAITAVFGAEDPAVLAHTAARATALIAWLGYMAEAIRRIVNNAKERFRDES